MPSTDKLPEETTQQQQSTLDSSVASARTVAHENTTHHTNIEGPAAEEKQKTAMHAMEMEDALPIPDARMNRLPRMPWSRHPFDTNADGIMDGLSFGDSSVEGLYYGDVMSSFPLEDDSIRPNYSNDSSAGVSRFQRFRKSIGASLRLSFSTPSKQDSDEDDESLGDFQDWTPPDSAYGAAFPVCGWVPKHYRRGIEATLIALFVFVLVYFVVTTSIRLSLDQGSEASGNSGSKNKFSDDDYYIDYYNDSKNTNDDEVNEAAHDDEVAADDDAVEDGDAVDGEEEGDTDEGQDGQEDGDEDGDGRLFLRLF